jgi:hypothetical protein
MPQLQSKGTTEKQVGRVLLISPTQNTDRRAMETSLADVIPSQTLIPSQHPYKTVAFWPR